MPSVIPTIAVDDGSHGVAVSPDGTRTYVCHSPDGIVSVIRNATNKVVKTIAVSDWSLGRLAVSPDSSRVYVPMNEDNRLSGLAVIDTATDTVLTTVVLAPQSTTWRSAPMAPASTHVADVQAWR